jgi:hypothetical protein
MALLGTFVWSLYEILSRIHSRDLTPSELYDVALRFVAAVPIGYAFSLLVFDNVAGFMAFALSAFPLRDVRLLIRKIALEKQKIEEKPQPASSSTSKGYTGELLSGLGSGTLARLQELNVETYLDLAYTDPIQLMVQTGAPVNLVLAWIDLALPAVYFPQTQPTLEQLGMPCASNVCAFYITYCFDVETGNPKENWQQKQPVKCLSSKLQTTPEILYISLTNLYADPGARFLMLAWNRSVKDAKKQQANQPPPSPNQSLF